MRAAPLMLAMALALGLPTDALQAATSTSAGLKSSPAMRTYIVVFDEPAAARFRGFPATDKQRPRLAATSPAATGQDRYDADSPQARAYVAYLDDLRRLRLGDASVRLGRPLVSRLVYTHAMNGMAVTLSPAEAEALATMPGVRSVKPEFHRFLQTDRGPAWIKADLVWSGAATGTANRGEGVVVGVIDSGINRSHVAFAGTGISNPLGGFRGYCVANPTACNTKLVGLWDFTVGAGNTSDPVDNDGHGTHVASTAVGNAFLTYSGVAPRANLIAYKACPDTQCNGSAILAAINQAVADGVDVINYSIGSGPDDPWATLGGAINDDNEAFLAAREAGIVVAVAAGNDGPSPGTHGNPGNAPWVIGVAAATHDRSGAGDRLASFSGRGPVLPLGVVKPDVTAPGVSIIAAGTSGATSTRTLSGTSMATPHVAGAAALVRSVNPALTPSQVVSALVLTARSSVTNGAVAATPHEQGAGTIDASLAVKAGVYLDVPAGGFSTARVNPYSGGAQDINLPSLAHGACFRTCSLTRVFKLMPGAAAGNYNVQVSMPAGVSLVPSVTSFTPNGGAGTSIAFSINVDAPQLAGKWHYGSVTLVNTAGGGRPNLKLPVAIYATPFASQVAETSLARVSRTVTRERDFFDLDLTDLVPLANARFPATNLVAPTSSTQTIAVDPSNDDPYDNVGSNYRRILVVPATPGGSPPVTTRLRVGTRAAAPDIDLFVGRDTNGNGEPDAGEELCRSTSAQSAETCELSVLSEAAATNYWVMVQNFSGAGTGVTVDSYVVPLVAGNGASLVATGPGVTAAGAGFKLRVGYDDATLVAGAERVGYVLIQPTAGSTAHALEVRLTRSGTSFEPFALAPGVGRAVTLPAGAAHERLFFTVPANATSVTFTTSGSGSVSLYAARDAAPTTPVVAAAPARNAAGVIAATAAGANQTITVSGAALQAGRWYLTPVNTGAGTAQVTVTATINSSGAALVAKPGSYFNAPRGGHGVFFYPSGPDLALLWYTYFQDGTPTWYYVQGAQPGANGVFNGIVYRSAWNGAANHLVAVGNLVIAPTTSNTFTMAYNIDGFTGAEPMQAFLTGCPTVGGSPLNVSSHWFNAAKPGYGYSVQVNANYEFHAVFAYDGLGQPRFLVAERGGAFNTGGAALPLEQLNGFAPLGPHAAPVRTTIGTLSRTYGSNTIASIASSGTYFGGLPGTWSESGSMTALSATQGCTP
ncbi:S8 family serine peptidase [Arenimonas sp. MALMAid1274]|uniref:S8 family serine peptidase n=1 Tax=Arenimonas sp. MALMAid1274 TaxID=3411630 RepID=UPI003BA220E5